jgi:hypothetical protein
MSHDVLLREKLEIAARDALRRVGQHRKKKVSDLTERVEQEVDLYWQARVVGRTHRDVHDALRKLWQLTEQLDPTKKEDDTTAATVERVQRLAPSALSYLDDRGKVVWTLLFGEAFPPHGFVHWAQEADKASLKKALLYLLSDGEATVQGRNRKDGPRSAAHIEPNIWGVVRGRPSAGLAEGHTAAGNGRPSAELEDELVQNLALAWLEVTEESPSRATSGQTGFGDLIFSVFEFLNLKAPEPALRRFRENTVPADAFKPGVSIS